MKLSDLGEFGLIERLKKHFPTINGDDAAVLRMTNDKCQMSNKIQNPKSKYLLITTDTLIENVHFILRKSSFYKLGYKALLANISDIAAMGGYPNYAVVTIGLSSDTEVSAVDDLYRGINKLAKKFKIKIIGGDTTCSEKVIVSITLLGEVEKENLLLRSGARVGDKILATRRPVDSLTHFKEARKIAKSRLATAMIDSSDGWARSVIEICRASRVGAKIYKDRVTDKMLYGGEDYNLIFTGSEKLAKLIPAKIIGEIIKGKKVLGIKSGGYEHFR